MSFGKYPPGPLISSSTTVPSRPTGWGVDQKGNPSSSTVTCSHPEQLASSVTSTSRYLPPLPTLFLGVAVAVPLQGFVTVAVDIVAATTGRLAARATETAPRNAKVTMAAPRITVVPLVNQGIPRPLTCSP